MSGVCTDTKTIGTSLGDLHPSQVRKIGNDINRNRETSKFKTYIDEVKRVSLAAIATLLDRIQEDDRKLLVLIER
jgi:hypothetical protein